MVIPTRDREAYLREAISSVFAQSYTSWELIVVDDGSTDGTLAYLHSLQHPSVHVIECASTGDPARLRNLGIGKARGEFVAFLDSDDLWLPEKLARQMATLAATPGAEWGYTSFGWINARGEVLDGPRHAPPPLVQSGWILEKLARHEVPIATPTVIVRRALVEELDGFDSAFKVSQDYDLWFRLAARAPAAADPAALTLIRDHGSRWSPTHPGRFQYWIDVCDRLAARVDRPEVRDAARRSAAAAALRWSADHRSRGEYRAALGKLALAHRYGASKSSVTLGILKTAVKASLPEPVLDIYRHWDRNSKNHS